MDLFGLNRFMDGGRNPPPRSGPGLWLQTLWDNLGGLLGGNALTFAGFLPLALGVSLGLMYESLWITLLAGAAGGALAGVFWAPMLSLALQAFRCGTRGWFARWRQAVRKAPVPAALAGAVLGLLAGGFLQVGALLAQLLGGGGRPPLPVWAVLCADFLLLSLAAAVLFPALCAGEGGRPAPRHLAALILAAPWRICAAALAGLAWFALGAALFPVSVPLALAAGFWPAALLTAQLVLPGLEAVFDLSGWDVQGPDPAPAGDGLTPAQRGEIWWRRRWPAVVILTACAGLLLWGGRLLLDAREPDLQIAVVHAQPLPDGVRGALERSLAGLVGDLNGDGAALVQVNDYTVVFDGAPGDADLQTAGATLLLTDLAMGDSALFLVEDPGGFLARYADKVDGTAPARWADYPALAALDAGSWSALDDMETDLPGQSLLEPLTVLPARAAQPEALDALLG